MEQFTFNSQFNVGDNVYHATQESDRGLIIDISYSVLARLVKYNVVFGIKQDDDVWCYEHELSEDKVF